jgi:hypothetical protein
MFPAGLELAVPASERRQTHALDSVATVDRLLIPLVSPILMLFIGRLLDHFLCSQ